MSGETPGKPGCDCKQGHMNSVAFHVESCPWRQRVLQQQQSMKFRGPGLWGCQ